jgi:hypothetical protein
MILALKRTPINPLPAAPILPPRLRAFAGVDPDGRIPWENQAYNRKSSPARQTMTAKPNSILKSMIKYLYPQFFQELELMSGLSNCGYLLNLQHTF